MSSYIFKASKCIMIDTVGKPSVELKRITPYSLRVEGNNLLVLHLNNVCAYTRIK